MHPADPAGGRLSPVLVIRGSLERQHGAVAMVASE
jgi:hypothetical protein